MTINENIVTQKLVTETGLAVPGRKAVVDLVSNRTLGVVSNRYKVVTNDALLRAIVPVAEEIGLQTEPQIVTCRGGAMSFFKFWGEKLRSEIGKGDIVRFGAEFFNSYDGSCLVGYHIIAERLICLNGQVAPRTLQEVTFRHMSGTNPGIIKKEFETFLPGVENTVGTWNRWNKIQPEYSRLEKFLEPVVPEKLRQQFLADYTKLPDTDQTVWGFYNILTAYLTHNIRCRKAERIPLKQFELGEEFANKLDTEFRAEISLN